MFPLTVQILRHAREEHRFDTYLVQYLRMAGAVAEDVKLPGHFWRFDAEFLLQPLPCHRHVVNDVIS